MQYTRFIILNGPPESGKSTIARELSRWLDEQHITNIADSFAAPMKQFIATALGQKYAQMAKDAPRAELGGYSVREFLIDLSENYIKPRYGESVYGRWFYHRVGRIMPSPAFVVCDDCGFIEEFDALGGAKKCILVRVERENKDFSNDSRSYLPDHNYTFVNNGNMGDLWVGVGNLGKWIMENYK